MIEMEELTLRRERIDELARTDLERAATRAAGADSPTHPGYLDALQLALAETMGFTPELLARCVDVPREEIERVFAAGAFSQGVLAPEKAAVFARAMTTLCRFSAIGDDAWLRNTIAQLFYPGDDFIQVLESHAGIPGEAVKAFAAGRRELSDAEKYRLSSIVYSLCILMAGLPGKPSHSAAPGAV
jgi:hypothetical protein